MDCPWGRKESNTTERLLLCYGFKKKVIIDCSGSSLLCVGFSLVAESGASSLVTVASLVEHGLWGIRAQQLWCIGMWDLPRSGIKPVSFALQGGFLMTGPPEKSLQRIFKETVQIKELLKIFPPHFCDSHS